MSSENYLFPERIYDYLLSISLREPEILRRLRMETASHPKHFMQIPPEQGQFLSLLVKLAGARKALEVGVFTGYSSLAVAMALPADGKLVACDISEEFTATARKYWAEAGVQHKVDLHIGPAIETLTQFLAEGQALTYDIAFIDADKVNYDGYYEAALALLRRGGLILVDNVFQHGESADPSTKEANAISMRAFNAKLAADQRVELSVLPLADGVTLALKK